jgi:hypothetical protein
MAMAAGAMPEGTAIPAPCCPLNSDAHPSSRWYGVSCDGDGRMVEHALDGIQLIQGRPAVAALSLSHNGVHDTLRQLAGLDRLADGSRLPPPDTSCSRADGDSRFCSSLSKGTSYGDGEG